MNSNFELSTCITQGLIEILRSEGFHAVMLGASSNVIQIPDKIEYAHYCLVTIADGFVRLDDYWGFQLTAVELADPRLIAKLLDAIAAWHNGPLPPHCRSGWRRHDVADGDGFWS